MNIKKKFLKEKAVYFPPGTPGPSGNTVPGTPEEISVRWEDREELKLEPNGDSWMSKAIVLVEKELELQGWLWYGTLEAWTDLGLSNHLESDDTFQIRRRDCIPARRVTPENARTHPGTLHRVTL